MKTIAVTGGKGGTGKSTFAILLAFKKVLQGKRVLLVDCDVECPNDYIILGIQKLKNSSQKTFTYYPKIDKSKCNKCGLCARRCKSNAIIQPKGEFPQINRDLCSSCGVCWTICPQKAIRKEEVMNGEIFVNKLDKNLTLVTGISKPGIRETSPVVRQTRKFVEKNLNDFDLCIIDTAAGTHCTVMSALEGVDAAYAVTEPTPLGAHDLRIILEVLDVLSVPSKIVINQFDIGEEEEIVQIADDFKTSVFVRIPYSRKLAKIYSEGSFMENKNLMDIINYS
jgi:MinD superfamily P-loop ATPase